MVSFLFKKIVDARHRMLASGDSKETRIGHGKDKDKASKGPTTEDTNDDSVLEPPDRDSKEDGSKTPTNDGGSDYDSDVELSDRHRALFAAIDEAAARNLALMVEVRAMRNIHNTEHLLDRHAVEVELQNILGEQRDNEIEVLKQRVEEQDRVIEEMEKELTRLREEVLMHSLAKRKS
ncbi:hypothetical protein BC567DRAFT_207405 [Phyllosticta citribraziliensis]